MSPGSPESRDLGQLLAGPAPGRCARRAVRVVAGGESLLAPAVTTTFLARVLPSLDTTAGARGLRAQQLDELIEREIDVLKLVAKGRSNAEIAGALFVSDTTVETHVSHVLSKLGLRDRVQAAVFAFETGLVGPEKHP